MLVENSLGKVHLRACLGVRLGSLTEASLIPLCAPLRLRYVPIVLAIISTPEACDFCKSCRQVTLSSLL